MDRNVALVLNKKRCSASNFKTLTWPHIAVAMVYSADFWQIAFTGALA